MARSNRDGQRKRRDSFPKRVPDLGYYIILTDADETEKNICRPFGEQEAGVLQPLFHIVEERACGVLRCAGER